MGDRGAVEALASTGYHEAGAALGREYPKALSRGGARPVPARLRNLFDKAAANPQMENGAWLLDNFRLIHGAEKEVHKFALGMRTLPALVNDLGAVMPRACLLAERYLRTASNSFQEGDLTEFLAGYQETAEIQSREIWDLKPALELELIDRLWQADPSEWPTLVNSLRKVGETPWKDLFEAISDVHRLLSEDPAGAYPRMDFDGRDRYRHLLAGLAKGSGFAEVEVAQAVLDLCAEAQKNSDGSRAAARRTHVGFYLADRGRARLEAEIGYRAPWSARIPRLLLQCPTSFYLGGIELLTLAIVFAVLFRLNSFTPLYAGLLFLILPATQAATDFINQIATFLVPPRVLPKLDFSEGIPAECTTMVAVPALLVNENQVRDLVLDLEIRFLANRDPNLYFALLTDPPDSDSPLNAQDELADLAARLIEGLNVRYGSERRAPFFLFHRHRTYNEAEGCWMGWERKRGKLLDLNQMLRGGFDAFPLKIGDLSILADVRYVITLDCDTQLPRDSAARLIGAIAHPLNQAVVDPATRMVVEGYGIVQPRIDVSVQSASRSRLAALYSGQTGFDIYTHAVSDVYQDLFGEGIFAGKGIYEVNTLRQVLENRFPENTLLSHDLIEGAYARAALASDIELIDDYPSHFSAYSRRKHRWVRGDWQVMRWLLPLVPDAYGRLIPNPITLISQWKILDNLRRSLLEPSFLFLLLAGWLWLPGRVAYWTAAAIAMWCVPAVSSLLFALLRVPRSWRAAPAWLRDAARTFRDSALISMCGLIFLLHQALISMDAVVRALRRAYMTKRKTLEWETAAKAESSAGKSPVDMYLQWTSGIALALLAAVWLVRPAAMPYAAPLLVLWMVSRLFSKWLNRRPRTVHSRLGQEDVQLLGESAERIWQFFHDWSSASTNWLIPDSVRDDGSIDRRLSPTNLGMLLNARIAAVHLGLAPLAEFVFETRQTLDQVVKLPKHRGHLFNWYDIHSLQPLPPLFVSTADSGNLAASLWTLKQAALALSAESTVKRGVTKELAEELREIAQTCDRLAREMDFRCLYQRRKKTLSVGYHVSTGKLDPGSYNLLASEARTASFVAIAKGDIPQESWFRLGRTHTIFSGDPVLLSWSGTMFEYLMPLLWMRHYPDTIIDRSVRTAIRSQREYARRRGVPWGISESAFLSGADGEYGYAAFGVPELALERKRSRSLVISPYSSFLAAGAEPRMALENLRRMKEFGWLGRYGFYEAVDYSRAGAEQVRMWMAHHQGMSLLAITNVLFGNPMRQYFHREPQVLATELLLHERVPAAALAEADGVRLPDVQPAPA
ncbi:MAG TPA: glucoamylase family protein [Bryobacteraceae bacterium]|nr:glucoamylase family protein [Bryobacteraceae bacterium]